MAKHNRSRKHRPQPSTPKPGSNPDDVNQIGGEGDFGVPAAEGRTPDRDYTSANVKASDPGAAQAGSSEFEGLRTHGAGGKATGDGSSSGGDLDPDFVGVGTGGGVAASGEIHRPPGPDDSDGTSNEMASGPPAQGQNQTPVREVVKGSTVSPDVDTTTGPAGQGADSTNNPARGDDAFSGEVSSGEARGEAGG